MSEDRRTEVVVVGAGPAGSAAAITLGRAGIETTLVDRARFPRDKCCGDGLTTGALRRLEALGLELSSVASFTPLTALAVRSPSGRTTTLPLHAGRGCSAAVARRVDLDTALVDLARPVAKVLEGAGLEAIEVAPTGEVRVGLSDGTSIVANRVIAADGAWSPTRRAIGGGRGPGDLGEPNFYAYRAYVSGVRAEALDRLWVSFPNALLPGYLWSFPVGESVNIGICLERPSDGGAGLAAAWREALADPFLRSLLGSDAVLESPARAWPIPAALTNTELVGFGGRVLFVGDAAGAADPFTGEGIAQALESGLQAADAVAATRGDPAATALTYRHLIRGSLGREHAIAIRLRALLSHPLGARGAVRMAGLNAFTRREVGRWMYEDYPRDIALTPERWRRATFTAPPPYAGPARVAPIESAV
jgi:menaquinone-9 beta-reductase